MAAATAVLLAAGEGKRMKSALPKVLHKICGRSLIGHVLAGAEAVTDKQVIVVGHGKEAVIEETGTGYTYVLQEEQLGTGHAVKMAEDHLDAEVLFVLCGDTPLLSSHILKDLHKKHQEQGALGTVLTVDMPDPGGYGRVVRGGGDRVVRIVEDKDATMEEGKIKEINTGTYCFHGPTLKKVLKRLSTNNVQGEYYLTDVMEILAAEGTTAACKLKDHRLALGVNTRGQLAQAAEVMREEINRKLMQDGVTLVDPHTTYVDVHVEIGMDTTIYPGTIIEGASIIGRGCVLGPNSHIKNSLLAEEVTINSSVITDSRVGRGAVVGPFVTIFPESEIGAGVKIDDFVEIKKSSRGKGTKIP